MGESIEGRYILCEGTVIEEGLSCIMISMVLDGNIGTHFIFSLSDLFVGPNDIVYKTAYPQLIIFG